MNQITQEQVKEAGMPLPEPLLIMYIFVQIASGPLDSTPSTRHFTHNIKHHTRKGGT